MATTKRKVKPDRKMPSDKALLRLGRALWKDPEINDHLQCLSTDDCGLTADSWHALRACRKEVERG